VEFISFRKFCSRKRPVCVLKPFALIIEKEHGFSNFRICTLV
jgi:hypothetical protein